MGVDPVTAGLGAVTMGLQYLSNQKAQSNANKSTKMAQANQDRINQAFDLGMKSIMNAENLGMYDPEKAGALFSQDYNRSLNTSLNNMAGSYRTMGYRPGDTTPITSMESMATRGANEYAKGLAAARMAAVQNELNAYNSLNSSAQGAMASLNTQQAGLYNSQQGSFASLLGGMIPQLGLNKPSGSTGTPVGGSWGSILPNGGKLNVKNPWG